ncbi:MAG TPA: cation-translocating P-type ATPase [Acidimicrobiia bacterium]|nr:cation-translocating P-type ATPase [Acidimicrobiia bacterium]
MSTARSELPTAATATRLDDVEKSLGADRSNGLDSDDALRRLESGRNELPTPPSRPWWKRVLHQLREPMSMLLMAAALISAGPLGEPVDALAIAVIVILNVAVAVVQEEKAATALEALRSAAAPTASVVRDGRSIVIPAPEVVPGDLVLLAAGDLVAADLWLVDIWSLEANESLLTGESLPVTKRYLPEADMTLPLADRTWMVYAGTQVTAGSGRGIVLATGPSTEVGKVAGHLSTKPTVTPLQKQLGKLSARLGQAAVAIAVAVFFLIIFRFGAGPGAVEEAFLAAVALAVAAVPEGLPAVVTLSLALGVKRMARVGAIVRNLPAVETLGSTTVLLTDKTGTLTQNRMRFESVIPFGRTPVAPDQMSGPIGEAVFRVVALCSDAAVDPPLGDPIEIALLGAFPPTEVHHIRANHPRIGSRPFDSTRKLMSTLHEFPPGFQLLTKGAPEQVLARSNQILTEDGNLSQLTDKGRAAVLAEVESLAAAGGRILALAFRPLEQDPGELEDFEKDLVLVGLTVLLDPLRPEAAETVKKVMEAGVHLVMVTGDHAGTASSVARAAGLSHQDSEVVTGSELRANGLPSDLASFRVFARVDPEQKLELVEAFQAAGHVVAVTGDGVNDAPALRKADIGVAMGLGGSQVAREAADLVITDDDLNLVTRAVREGRAIFENIRKVVDYLVAGNISEVTVVLVGLAAFPGLGIPLFPLQLLWINLLTDGLPALALGFDHPRRELAFRPAGLKTSQLLAGRRLSMLAARGVLLACGAIGALAIARSSGGSWEEARTVMFMALVVSHLLYAFVVRMPLDGNFFNPRLIVAIGAGLLFQAGTVLEPFRDLINVVPIAGGQWLLAMGAGVIPVVVLWAVETLRSRRS